MRERKSGTDVLMWVIRPVNPLVSLDFSTIFVLLLRSVGPEWRYLSPNCRVFFSHRFLFARGRRVSERGREGEKKGERGGGRMGIFEREREGVGREVAKTGRRDNL